MSQRIDGRHINILIEHDMIAEIDRISAKLDLKRNELLRNMLAVSLDILHGYEAIGVLKLVEIKRRAKKAIMKETQPTLF